MATSAPLTSKLPTPVRTDSRICFGLAWFLTEKDADIVAADVQRRGITYNGGFFDGMSCGRDHNSTTNWTA